MELCQIKEWIEKEKIKTIRLSFFDLLGHIKYVFFPASRMEELMQKPISFDGSSITGYAKVERSDLFLRPDFEHVRVVKKEVDEPFLNIFCFIEEDNGVPHPLDGRSRLHYVLEQCKQKGIWPIKVGFESEFYLLKDGEYADKRSYFDPVQSALQTVLDQIVARLEAMDFKIKSYHHEVGPGQFEINYQECTPIEAIDQLILLQEIVKFQAEKAGYQAVFSPKIERGKPGNGLHLNLSLWNGKRNLFYEEGEKKLSPFGLRFMNGILQHATSMMVFSNLTQDSYLRLHDRGLEAPNRIRYGLYDRSACIRIPKAKEENTRIEIRNVDATSHYYYLIYFLLRAGLEGAEKSKMQEEKVLPLTLDEAIQCAKEDDFLQEIFGKEVMRAYLFHLEHAED